MTRQRRPLTLARSRRLSIAAGFVSGQEAGCNKAAGQTIFCRRGGLVMAKHTFLVLTNPVQGKEKEYNDWYTNQHIPDVVSVPGIVAAQRYKLADFQMGTGAPSP